jgi:hypothetical protein
LISADRRVHRLVALLVLAYLVYFAFQQMGALGRV